MRRSVASLFVLAVLTQAVTAEAGVVSDENGKSGLAGNWTASNDGTARFDGVVDVYPAQWSIAPGDALKLKVRSTTGYTVRVMRLGWYGGAGAREIKTVAGQAASPQPYPTADAKFGMAEARWSDSVTIATDATWTTGLYVARIEAEGGKQAVTFFTVRDDGMTAKQPILVVVGLATHAVYNAWPGPERGGKSLYGFNSSPVHPTESIGELAQAVKVSLDRPFLVGGGMADVGGYEYPFIRWLEKNGYEVAYCTDEDLDRDPAIAMGRKVITFSGHEEYTSRPMYDAALAARDAGANFLFLSGDTWSWQVRFEPGNGGPRNTIVGYKESWVRDPMQREAYSLQTAGKIEEAKAKYRLVSRGWKNLQYDPAAGIDERRPGMLLTGVQSAGIIRDAAGSPMHGGLYPWADFVVTDPTFWFFEGTGLKAGDKIANVFGYEVDSTLASNSEFDKFRPTGQRVLGAIKQVSDGKIKGSAAFYRTSSGAEVIAIGAIFTSWALDDWAAKAGGFSGTVDARYDTMIRNALTRWSGATVPPPPPPAPDAGTFDAGQEEQPDPVEKDGGTFVETGPVTGPGDSGGTAGGSDTAGAGGAPPAGGNVGGDGGGCTLHGGTTTSLGSIALAVLVGTLTVRRRRHRRSCPSL